MKSTKLSAERLDELRAVLAAKKFESFVHAFWPVVSSDPLVAGYHFSAICDHLQAVADGQIRRLVLNCPIRHGKSLLTSVFFPAWLWVRWPERRVITASFSDRLATRDAVRSRQILDSEQFKRWYGGGFSWQDDQNQKTYQRNNKGGERLVTSVGAKLAGFDADLIVADDLPDLNTRNSQASRASTLDFFDTALSSRLVHSDHSAMVVAGNRVHQDDLYQSLLDRYGEDPDWVFLVLPCEADPQRTNSFASPIGWKDTREPGEILWPEKYTPQIVSQEKKKYRADFSTLFNQLPCSPEGSVFRKDHFRTYTRLGDDYLVDGVRVKPSECVRIVTTDLAITTTETSDWTVCQSWDLVGGRFLLIDQLRGKLDGTKLIPRIKAFCERHKPEVIGVEMVAFQRMLFDQLREADLPVVPFSPQVKASEAGGSNAKEIRSVEAQIAVESGKVYLPADGDFVGDFLHEVLAFPNAKHDDQVDCLSMVAHLAKRYDRTEFPVVKDPEAIKKEQADELNESRRKMFDTILNSRW